MMKQPKQRYHIGSYVSVWQSDGANHKGVLLIEDGSSLPKITVGKELIVRQICNFDSPQEPINLGVVEQGQNYRKLETVEIRCAKSWYIIEFNPVLATLLECLGGQSDIFD